MRRQKPASWLNAFVAVVGVEGRRRAVHAGVRGRLRREQTVRDADGRGKRVLLAQKGRRDSHGACGRQPRQVLILGYVSGDTRYTSTSFDAIDMKLGHRPGLGTPRATRNRACV